jgi:UDP-N-acetylglucosamine diphosphorylase/glucosamine-1-phosphate N-acetyltransferase
VAGSWQLTLFETPHWQDLKPFTWTRPIWALRCGARTILERAETVCGRPALRIERSEVLATMPLPLPPAPWRPAPTLFLDARWLAAPGEWLETLAEECGDRILEDREGRIIGALIAAPREDAAGVLLRGGGVEVLASANARRLAVESGRWIDRPWSAMSAVAAEVRRDFELGGWESGSVAPDLGPGTHVAGDAIVWMAGARTQGGAFLDSRSGPIIVAAGAVIGAGSVINGPAYIGPSTQLFAARIDGGVAFGPVCRLGGEIQSSIVQGYSNKYHDGFLGHAHLGSWVNLGANTTNSDLKNTYGKIQIDCGAGRLATGSSKIGALIGDHVKTAIGTLLYTGTVVDVGATLFAGAPASGYVPAFVWATERPVAVTMRRFLEVATTVLGRRGLELSPDAQHVLERIFRDSDAARERYLELARKRRS